MSNVVNIKYKTKNSASRNLRKHVSGDERSSGIWAHIKVWVKNQ